MAQNSVPPMEFACKPKTALKKIANSTKSWLKKKSLGKDQWLNNKHLLIYGGKKALPHSVHITQNVSALNI